MRKITLLLFIVFSQTIFSAAKITETEKLVATCKVWGFLKYYHPKVAGGEVNWDNQLLEKLPLIEKTQTKEEFSLILEKWIDELGTIKEIAPIPVAKEVEYFDKNFDLSWFDNKFFSKKLSKKLKFIEENRFQGKQYYIEGAENVGNVHLINESGANPDFENKNSKLRIVFMYWNLIEYFFPYKYLMDQKWDTTLEKVIPQAISSKGDVEFLDVMRKLAFQLNDSHVDFFTYQSNKPKYERRYFPADGRIIDGKFVVTEILGDSLAQAYDIKIGNVITKIDNKTINELILENREFVCASNESKYLDVLAKRIVAGTSENVVVEFLEDGKYISKTMFWGDYHDSHRNEFKKGVKKKKEKFKLLENNTGYVDMGILKSENVPDMINMMKSTKAIVFDLRNYPKGTIIEISDFINPHEKKFAVYTVPDLSYPGRFKWNLEGTSSGFENKDNYKGKVIVLINEKAISHSEWSAMCFRGSGNATIIGSQTAGADGNVSQFYFDSFSTLISGIGVYYPDKTETQRIGIIPDIEVKPTIEGIKAGKDEVLDRALLFIETGK